MASRTARKKSQVSVLGMTYRRIASRAASLSYVMAGVAAMAALAWLSRWGRGDGIDLRVYRDAAHYWAAGGNPYHAAFTPVHLAFTYPPFALLALTPLSLVSFPAAEWLLWAASIAAGTVSVLLVLRDRGIEVTPRAWCGAVAWSCFSVIALEPVRSALDYGQIELLLMGAVVTDLLLVRAPYRGLLTGIAAAVKLSPLIFILVLAMSRDVKSALRMALTFAACMATFWVLWPGMSTTFWLHDMLQPTRAGSVTYSSNQTWYAILHRPPFPASGSTVAWVLLSLMTVAVGAFVAWRLVTGGHRALAILPVALAGLLVSPISWNHHWVWLMLIPPLLAARRGDVARPVQALLWGLVALAVLAPYWWFSHGVAADAFDAVLPLWACAVLVAWAVSCARSRAWRAAPRPWPEPRRAAAPETPASGPAARH
jgi:alpha-1,2-mannosyltransferase